MEIINKYGRIGNKYIYSDISMKFHVFSHQLNFMLCNF